MLGWGYAADGPSEVPFAGDSDGPRFTPKPRNTHLVIGNPEAGLKSLFEALTGLVPANAHTLVVDYVDRTLRTASTGALVLGILGALWLGQAASISITKAANRSYRLQESRPFWRLRGTCLIITLGFTLLIAVLTLAQFNVGAYA